MRLGHRTDDRKAPMLLLRPLHHLRRNVISYSALFLAVGVGGGFAIAATSNKTIHGCVNNRTRALFLEKRCRRGQSAIVWNQRGPQGLSGTPTKRAFDVVNFDGTLSLLGSRGISAQHSGTGTYSLRITASACTNSSDVPTITVTQAGNPSVTPPPAAVPTGWIENTRGDNEQFVVHTGYLSGGVFTAADLRFDVDDDCQ